MPLSTRNHDSYETESGIFYAHQRMVEIIITFYQNDESFQQTQRKLSTHQTKALDGSRNKFKIISFEVLDFIIIFVAYSK